MGMKKPYKFKKQAIYKKQKTIEWIIGPENSCHGNKS
jgi:hypothetical protein